MGRGVAPTEKAKDFKETMKKLIRYMASFKIQIFFVAVFAICGTIFNIAGPKILGKATTEIFNGLVSKVSGGSGMDFGKIGTILATALSLYLISAACSLIQGFLMTGVSQKTTYKLRKEISQKINRMPMNYFDTKPVGEVLSRVTNDVDTLGQSLNQSATQLITSVTTIIGVLVMMLSISPLMTLVALLILPLSMLLLSFVMKHSQKYFVGQQEYLGNVNGQVEEIYSGHNIIKAFNKEEAVIREFNETNGKLYDSAWKSQFFSGMMMPVMQFNKSCCSKKFAEVYDAVGGTGAGTDTEKADWVINRMDAMVKHLDIPTSLKPYGVTEADLPALVKAGMDVQRLLVNNPRTVTAADAEALYRAIL